MPPSFRGPEIDDMIIAAFAALVWHTPSLRQHISRYGTLPQSVRQCCFIISVGLCVAGMLVYVLLESILLE